MIAATPQPRIVMHHGLVRCVRERRIPVRRVPECSADTVVGVMTLAAAQEQVWF